jgi:hypothetical protein
MGYARESFKYVATICDYIIEQKLDRYSPIHHPLCVTIAIFYARPFKRSNVIGSIPETMVRKSDRFLHRQLLTMRDQIAAHTDADCVKHCGRPANNVQMTINQDGTGTLSVNELKFSPEAIASIRELAKGLIEKTTYHVERLWQKLAREIPDWPGSYFMDVSAQKFVKITPHEAGS